MGMEPYLRLMVDKGASDLFFSVSARPEVKVEGKSRPIGHERLDRDTVESLVAEVLGEEQRSELATEHEVNTSLSVPGIGRFRVYAFHQRGEPAMVLRLIKHDIPDLESLGLPPMVADLVMEKRGLILVVGATGSGKSTTMASMVDHRNANTTGHIITIEDPIEFIHEHKRSVVDQREIGIDTLSYEHALRNTLRGAPDMVVIGEIRDAATMQHAIRFAETGHLSLASMHANNANQAVERAVNFFPEDAKTRLLQDLALQLRAIVAQRLIPGVGGRRVAAIEMMLNAGYITDLIEQGRVAEIKEQMDKQADGGQRTFDHAVLALWRAGKISPREALRYADSANAVRMQIQFEKPGTLSTIDPEDLIIHDE